MRIKNKLDCMKQMKQLHLNQFAEELFKRGEEDKIIAFLNKYPFEFYAVRSRSIVGCKLNNFKTPRNEVLNTCKLFDCFSINVSSYNFTNNLVLIGDARISKDGEVWLIASKNKNYTGRMAEANPDYNLKTTLFDKRLNKIPAFDKLLRYIVDHNLLNVIVEFAIYNKPVGINKENIIIFEIRTDY